MCWSWKKKQAKPLYGVSVVALVGLWSAGGIAKGACPVGLGRHSFVHLIDSVHLLGFLTGRRRAMFGFLFYFLFSFSFLRLFLRGLWDYGIREWDWMEGW